LIGKTVAKLWPFFYIQDGRQPPSWDFIEQQIVPFDPPNPKTLALNKHGVDRMHRLQDICL